MKYAYGKDSNLSIVVVESIENVEEEIGLVAAQLNIQIHIDPIFR